MIDKDVIKKMMGFWKFAFSGLAASLLLGFGSMILFITLAVLGYKLSGNWFVGDSFDTWWQTISMECILQQIHLFVGVVIFL